MSIKYAKPTVKQRIHLLTIAGSEVRRIANQQFAADAHSADGYQLDEAAAMIFAEVERMELKAREWDLQRKMRKQAKTTPEGVALTT